MTTLAVLNLIAQVGLPLAQQLLVIYESGKTTVTSADLETLMAYATNTSSLSLANAQIKIVDGKVVPA